ncbi:unnamed protein product, partial [Amoebophrya sp. A120]
PVDHRIKNLQPAAEMESFRALEEKFLTPIKDDVFSCLNYVLEKQNKARENHHLQEDSSAINHQPLLGKKRGKAKKKEKQRNNAMTSSAGVAVEVEDGHNSTQETHLWFRTHCRAETLQKRVYALVQQFRQRYLLHFPETSDLGNSERYPKIAEVLELPIEEEGSGIVGDVISDTAFVFEVAQEKSRQVNSFLHPLAELFTAKEAFLQEGRLESFLDKRQYPYAAQPLLESVKQSYSAQDELWADAEQEEKSSNDRKSSLLSSFDLA